MSLDTVLEAILFWKGEPLSVKRLATILKKTEEEIKTGLEELEQKLTGRGLQIVYKDDEVMLGTKAELGPLIEALRREELVKDLGKAGLETLSIILYRGPVSRRDIDYIRGVQSQFIIRNLLVRGLIEKIQNEKDERQVLYRPTFDLLTHLGVSKVADLPEYEATRAELEKREQPEPAAEPKTE